ncbi:MAG: efflux RND transporter permease subunit [Planctomycetota bacterium]
MKNYIRRVLARPVGILVASVAVIIMGVISFGNIPLQMLPEGMESRHISIDARLRDSSPAEAERHVAIPLEESLGTVAGIESISSRSSRDRVRISLELKRDADVATVERDVRDRANRVEPDLPDDVDRLRVQRRRPNDRPVMFFSVTASIDRLLLSDFMEDHVIPQTESVDGVARTGSWGLLKRTVRIRLDKEEVSRRGLDLRELLRRLRGDNLSSDLGDVRDGNRKAYLRAGMEFESLEEIRAFPVLTGVRLGEIAEVSIVPALDEGWSRFNGKAVIVGTIYKAAGENTVDVCRRVRATFDRLIAENPDTPGLEFRPFFDQGEVIENSLLALYKNALYGGILAIIVLYGFFRRLRMTVLVAASIPLSLTIAVTVLYLGGDSLNLGTLMGLTLSVGMLIDNAIVVVESILRRREIGDSTAEAAAAGTGEVALAVVTATLTTIVVFLPTIFLSGESDIKVWLLNIGKPLAFALLGSLAVALVLIPLGSIYLRKDKKAKHRGHGELEHGVYARMLRWALHHRFATIVIALLVMMSQRIPMSEIGQRGSRGREQGPVRIQLRFPRHYTMSKANEAVKQYEEYVLGVKDELEIDGIFCRFDDRGGRVMMWKREGSEKPKSEIQEQVEKGWPKIPGIWTSLESSGENSARTRLTLEGEDADVLEQTMDRIENQLKHHPLVAETSRERDIGLQELAVSVDPEAVERGRVVPELIRGMIGWVLRGARLKDYRGAGRDLPLLMELDPDQEVEMSDLGGLLIPTDDGMQPLGTLARMGIRRAPSSIERRDGRRVAELYVTGKGDDEKAFHGAMRSFLGGIEMPVGVRSQVGGSWRNFQQSMNTLFTALGLGLCLVFLLTGILFEAILLPFAVILAVPPAFTGAYWALYIVGKPLDELAMLGLILLVGIVVNNGIVLVDRVQQYRRQGLPLRPAVLAAGRDRVRPVVMTAFTTIVGLLPMAIFKGTGDEIAYDTLAVSVMGGLVVSTLITLFLVPVAFTLFTDLTRATARGIRRITGLRPETA